MYCDLLSDNKNSRKKTPGVFAENGKIIIKLPIEKFGIFCYSNSIIQSCDIPLEERCYVCLRLILLSAVMII